MQHFKTLLTAFVIVFTIARCKKEKITEPVPAPFVSGKLLKQIDILYSNGNTYFYKFNYDVQKRVIGSESKEDIITQSYPDGKIEVTEFRKSLNRIVGQTTANIGSTGKVYKQTGEYNYNGTPFNSITDVEYDNSGYPVSVVETRNDGSIAKYEYTIQNGNIIKIKHSFNGAEVYTDSFEYYADKSDKINIVNVYFSTYWVQNEFGKKSVNMIKSRKTTYPGTSSVNTLDYSYEIDAQGYIIKANVIHSNGLSRTETYTWQ